MFREDLLAGRKPLAELPFDTERKMMTVFFQEPEQVMAAVKGAPDRVLARCTHYLDQGEVKPLTAAAAKAISQENEALAGQALRVLGLAYRYFPALPASLEPESVETGLTFAGLVAMIDPPRPEVKLAIGKCREAGVRTVMITGDHKNTAVAIARELGFFAEGDEALTGLEVDALTDEELEQPVAASTVLHHTTITNRIFKTQPLDLSI